MTSKLEKIRVERGISQSRLEIMSGVKQQQISLIERGRPINSIEQAKKLAKALNCKPGDLLDIDVPASNLETSDLKNIHKYFEATTNLTGTPLRRVADLLNLDVSELKDFRDESTILDDDDGLLLSFVALLPFVSKKISSFVRERKVVTASNDKEKEVLEAFRGLTPEEQERFIHLIKATPLIK